MEPAFNPYLKWLGIPLKHQPPTHYRLLGVEQLEADPDIIERAADRQMAYIRSLQSGEQATVAQQLLNEISAAKVCLLDDARKAEYDARLQSAERSGIQAKPKVAAVAAAKPAAQRSATPGERPLRAAKPLPMSRPQPVAGGKSSGFAVAPVVGSVGAGARPLATPKSSLPLVIGAAAGGLLLLLVLLVAGIVLSSADDTTDVAGAETAGPSTVDRDPPLTGRPSNTTTGRQPATNVNPPQGYAPDEFEDPFNDPTHPTNGSSGTTPVRAHSAIVQIDAKFLLGKIENGESILSDRDYALANVAQELRGLEFTRWQYGPPAPFKIARERAGDLYLILPPDQYARPLPQVSMPGWDETSLECEVVVEGGRRLACRVLRCSSEQKEVSLTTSSAIWPIVAAGKIHKRTRILGDIVEGSDPPPTNETPVVKPPPSGGVDEPRPPADDETQPAPSEKVAKVKVPASDAQKPIRQKVAQLYDIESLKTSDEKLRVAKSLLGVAQQPSDKPDERYVMLATGAQLAADAGDLVLALEAIDIIAGAYDGDTSAMKLHLARMFAKSNVPSNLKAQQLAYIIPVIDEGLANDHFDAIDELVTDLLAARLRHPALAGRRRVALDMKTTYRAVVAARKTLAATPTDGESNRIVGEYLCYYKLDWENGLPHLALADDAALKAAATLDTSNPEVAAEQLAVADHWYRIADDVDVQSQERKRGSLLARALQWYDRVAGNLQGLDEAHAKKRVDEINSELERMGWVDVPRKAIIAAASGYRVECYLNGNQLFVSSYRDIGSSAATLKRGDILTFKATRSSISSSSSSKGFACVIAFEGGSTPVATGLSAGWEGYAPADRFNWYQPRGIASRSPVVVSSGLGHTELATQTGVGARSIWYAGLDSSEGYFVYRVR